jgi:hypothetical protein
LKREGHPSPLNSHVRAAARVFLTTTAVSGVIYAIGGSDGAISISANEVFSPISGLVTSVGPSDVWIGLKNSDDVGTSFDLRAEVYISGVLVGSGELLNVPGGSSGFNNARLRNMPLTLTNPQPTQGVTLEYKLYVRVSQQSSHRSGTARLWYSDGQANSSVDVSVDGTTTRYYLRSDFALCTLPGAARRYSDVLVDRAKW